MLRRLSVLALSFAVTLAAGAASEVSAAQLGFTDVSVSAGVAVTNSVIGLFDHAEYTGGGTVADFNNDGFQDLFVISGGTGLTRDWLFINNGDGTFTDRAEKWGLTLAHLGKGAGAADINHDGFVDLFVTSAGTFGRIGPGHHKLYRNNGNSTFTSIATTAGVNFNTSPQQGEDGFGVAFGDIDLDGDLDLFLAGFADDNAGNRLYRNNGDETFTDVTESSELFLGLTIDMRSFAPRLVDMDGDHYPELLLASDFGTSRYFRNDGDGTFTDLTVASGTGLDENGMGNTVGDFDGNGLLDWYVTSIYLPLVGWTGNKLYMNQGGHSYTQIAATAGVANGGYGWGAVAVDFNHDRRLDIASTNGDYGSTTFGNDPTKLWQQNANGTFTETAQTVGIQHFARGRGLVNFDYDNDGDQDLVIFCYGDQLRLYRNDLSGADRNWLRVLLDTSATPALAPHGYGAKVSVTAGGTTQVRVINGGDNFLSHSELSAHFGLSNSGTVTTLRVDWPDGSATVLSGVTANRTLVVRPGPRETTCTNGTDDDQDLLVDCNDPDCCGLAGCTGSQGVCCTNNGTCNDGQFCNGVEQCIDHLCVAAPSACPGQACNEGTNVCVECMLAADCDDGSFCNGVETCSASLCAADPAPCPGQMCEETQDACVECLDPADCSDDSLFCNGVAACISGQCEPALDACAGRGCNEATDSCVGAIELQPRIGQPLLRLTGSQAERFAAGRQKFESTLDAAAGLGPAYNATRCSGCHSAGPGGAGATVTRFGVSDGQGGVDPLPGGPVLQAGAISPACLEVLPPQADIVAPRVAAAFAGSGLIDSLDDGAIYLRVSTPPSGVSGRTQVAPILEQPGEAAIGRFGWKASQSTARSTVADQARDHLGLSSSLVPIDTAPNGDGALLAQCDVVADPEDQPDPQGFEIIDRLTDYVRLLAAPPQTPRSGMLGETLFGQLGCTKCHVAAYWTNPDPRLEAALYARPFRPYSDFLLHDLGAAGDAMEEQAGLPGEVRTTPLWGLIWRDTLWHDGRFAAGTFESRVTDAIAEHGVAGSEGTAAAGAFAALSPVDRSAVIAFLGSLGRAEFDQDGDNDVDAVDLAAFDACFTGPGTFYTANHACAIFDVDQDGDVDGADRAMFDLAADGGAVDNLRIGKLGAAQIHLSWDPSCSAADVDHEIYLGTLGNWGSHAPVQCTTSGLTELDLGLPGGSTYYLVVPQTGLREGSYGRTSAGVERPASPSACRPQAVGDCS